MAPGKRKLEKNAKTIKDIYFNPANTAGFKGKARLRNVLHNKVSDKTINEWLEGTESYTLHRPVTRNFPRRKFIAAGVNSHWQADLADFYSISRKNDGFKYLLCVVDTFSRKLFVAPLKNKSGPTVTAGFDTILSENTGAQPQQLTTDKGKEFYNASFQRLLREHNIHHYSTYNQEIKAGIAERTIRTLKSSIYRYLTHTGDNRYIDRLQEFVKSYNNTQHSALGVAPDDVKTSNQEEIWQRLYSPETLTTPTVKKFVVGDRVRISKYATVFRKGYLPQWSEEIFVVAEVLKTIPVTYIVSDDSGDRLKGSFYEKELQKVRIKDDVYRIEKIVGQRKINGKIQYLVRWKGYPPEFDSYVPKGAIIDDYKN